MRRILPENVNLIPKGTHVVLTLGGFDDQGGRYVRSIWDPKSDRGRGSGLIGLDRGKPRISWYSLGAHHVWINTQTATLIELWALGIRARPHPRGVVISATDELTLTYGMPRRTAPNRNRLSMGGGTTIVVSPDWMFDPLALAKARLAAHALRFARQMLGALTQLLGTITGLFSRKNRTPRRPPLDG